VRLVRGDEQDVGDVGLTWFLSVSCKQLLCFKIDDKLSGAGALKVAGIFSNQLISGHTELCPWRGNPSPEAFMTVRGMGC
jgi:hypothetical protein